MGAFSRHILEKKEAAKKRRDKPKTPLQYTKINIKHFKEDCLERNQDLVLGVLSGEGSGKSTFAANLAELLEPGFDLNETLIKSYADDKFSFLGFFEKYKNTRFKVAWFDEAVTVLFSLNHKDPDVIMAQKLYKVKRECCHFDILVAPSPYDLTPYIRKNRLKGIFYTFVTVKRQAGRKQYQYWVAFFGAKKIPKLVNDPKCRDAYRQHSQLFKLIKPDFIDMAPDFPERLKIEYASAKKSIISSVFDEARNKSRKDKGELTEPDKISRSGLELKQSEVKKVEKRLGLDTGGLN